MGCKRAFDNDDFQVPVKHHRHYEHANQQNELAPVFHWKPYYPVENDDHHPESLWYEPLEMDTIAEVSYLADKDFQTSSSSEEDSGSRATTFSSFSPEYIVSDFAQRTFTPFEGACSSLLDGSPRRQVPIGPNHQACLPKWHSHIKGNNLDQVNQPSSSFRFFGEENIYDNDKNDVLMGACVIPMPKTGLHEGKSHKIGDCQMDCDCMDGGSIRCVQQHITEAREQLRKALGTEKFVNLGFFDMGEEVALKWSEEEEDAFHHTVYSNPVSLGRNFWKHLAMVFPSRSRKEIVSYYFNVFMLRKRAAQNRSKLLDIDSDDDEWNGSNGVSFKIIVQEEDEDSAIESLVVRDDMTDHEEEDSPEEYDSDDDRGDDASDDDGVIDGRFDTISHQMDKNGERLREGFDFQDDSCMSSECQINMSESFGPVDTVKPLLISGDKSNLGRCLRTSSDASSDMMGYVLDPCDSKMWDTRSPICATKNVDLLPTSKMIEEIFGEDREDYKARDD